MGCRLKAYGHVQGGLKLQNLSVRSLWMTPVLICKINNWDWDDFFLAWKILSYISFKNRKKKLFSYTYAEDASDPECKRCYFTQLYQRKYVQDVLYGQKSKTKTFGLKLCD